MRFFVLPIFDGVKDEIFCFAHLRWCYIHYDAIEDGQNKKPHLLFSFLVRIVLFLHFIGRFYLSKILLHHFIGFI